jgi:hypothetical protein
VARLPSERYLIQDIGGRAVLFEDGTERELASFEAAREDFALLAQVVIATDDELGDEDRCFAHFWSGYLHAHASGMQRSEVSFGLNLTLRPGMLVTPEDGDMILEQAGDPPLVIVSYPARDGNRTAQAQKVIHDMELLGSDRALAHFWSGYFWARYGAVA